MPALICCQCDYICLLPVAQTSFYLKYLRSEKVLAIVGSPYWMAPECIVGKTRYNEKVLLHITHIYTGTHTLLCNYTHTSHFQVD